MPDISENVTTNATIMMIASTLAVLLRRSCLFFFFAIFLPLFVICFVIVDLECPVNLFEKHYPGQLVRKGDAAE